MDITELKAEKRSDTGKGVARKLRAQGKIPAVLYGHDMAPMSIAINAKDFQTFQRGEAGAQVIKLTISGEKSKPMALIKEIQHHKVRGFPIHLDLQKVAMDEDITANLQIVSVGEAPGLKLGGVMEHHLWEVTVQGKPTDLPPQIEADISELQVGDNIHVRDLKLPDKITLVTALDELVLSILAPKVEAVAAPAEEIVEAEAEVLKEPVEEAATE